ncbi:MAG: hypothetical protein KJ000_11735 [Pirellulaceae bacterium]|nr:hypothetical protein [Pirellulaceae bacterium]
MQSFLLALILCTATPEDGTGAETDRGWSHDPIGAGAEPVPRSSSLPDIAVVCPEDFREALSPWVAHRVAQGYRPVFLNSDRSAAELRDDIRRFARSGQLRYVVLVGDAAPDVGSDRDGRRNLTPTHYVPARVNVRWGSEPEIATDNPYGDMDGDSISELAVGRLSVRSADELRVVVQKILDYENSTDHGPWHRKINLVAGVGGFSPLADSILELATRKFLTDGIPDDYETTMTYASWQSPYCPDPRRFRDVALARMNEGCLFWVYIGHGHRRQLDAVRTPAASYPILTLPDVAGMNAQRGLPIALMLACYTGAFDLPQDCLAEFMLRQPRGPVAVIGGSRVTMPYAMAVMSNALMDQVFRAKATTLGEAFLRAKQAMVHVQPEDSNRQLLDALAAAVSPLPDRLADERHEHLALFNLLGDPLLRIRRPAEIDLGAPENITAGETLTVSGHSNMTGRGVVEVVSRRDRLKTDIPTRRYFEESEQFLRSLDEDYQQANDSVWVRQAFAANGEAFAVNIDLPPETRGPCYVRAWIESPDGAAQGATRVFVHRALTTGAE